MTTIYWNQTGPLLKYESAVLRIEDLNPQMETRWRVSRSELIMIGLRCILAALSVWR